MVSYDLHKYKHIYVYTLPSCGRMFKELVIVAASGEKLLEDWREILYISYCPYYTVYHVHVLPIHIFNKEGGRVIFIEMEKYKMHIVSTKSRLQNGINRI